MLNKKNTSRKKSINRFSLLEEKNTPRVLNTKKSSTEAKRTLTSTSDIIVYIQNYNLSNKKAEKNLVKQL